MRKTTEYKAENAHRRLRCVPPAGNYERIAELLNK